MSNGNANSYFFQNHRNKFAFVVPKKHDWDCFEYFQKLGQILHISTVKLLLTTATNRNAKTVTRYFTFVAFCQTASYFYET